MVGLGPSCFRGDKELCLLLCCDCKISVAVLAESVLVAGPSLSPGHEPCRLWGRCYSAVRAVVVPKRLLAMPLLASSSVNSGGNLTSSDLLLHQFMTVSVRG